MKQKTDDDFIAWWEANKARENNLVKQIITGLPLGLLMGIGMVGMIWSGWYERANMEAFTKFNPTLLVLIICIIAIFAAVFYKRFQCEMYQQRYDELIFKKNKLKSKVHEESM